MKKPWLSKTVWFNAVVAILAFVPGFDDALRSNQDFSILLMALINGVLRLTTKEKISLH